MLKDQGISRYTARRTHRTYAPKFKAELVMACQAPGASIAALFRQNGMNANVLHRGVKEHGRSGCHASAVRSAADIAPASPAFIPLTLPAPIPVLREQEIRGELRKGAVSMVITWPACAAGDFASWTAAILE